MKRTLTKRAFVSSTFLDLQDARKLISEQLVASGILPVGMEIFPGAGGSPWRVITSAIDQCDLYILIVAGRYGSLASESVTGRRSLSWTEMEYEYAQSLGKQVIPLMYRDPSSLPGRVLDSDTTEVERFRHRLEAENAVRYYSSDLELVTGLHVSLAYAQTAAGESFQPTEPIGEPVSSFLSKTYDRRYEFVGADWSHRLSVHHLNRWDALCTVSRVIRANWPEGVANWTYSISKPSGMYHAIFPDDPPIISDFYARRSDSGSVSLREKPRRIADSSYIHEVDFVPGLRQDEICNLQFQIMFPGYRFDNREDVERASTENADGSTDSERVAFDVGYPTDHLVITCSFPEEFQVESLQYRVTKSRTAIDRDEMERIRAEGLFTLSKMNEAGTTFLVATLDVPSPGVKRTSEIRWRPPHRDT